MFQNQANGQHKSCLKTTKFPWQWPHAAQGSLQTTNALASVPVRQAVLLQQQQQQARKQRQEATSSKKPAAAVA